MLKRSGMLVLLLLLIVTGFPCFVYGADTDLEYRALVIGNAEYCDESSSLLSVPGDVMRMSRVLAQSIIVPGIPQFSSIKQMNNITGKEILAAIESTFKDASNKDVSLFYFAGHGVLDAKGQAFLCGVDAVAGGVLGVDELEKALRQIPGTKIIILDCCYAGGFITILEEKRKAKDVFKADGNINQFNNAVLASFSKQPRSFPEHKHYKVLTSCAPKESAFGVYDDELKGYGGEFTNSFVKGAGIINGDYRADFDCNNIVSLDEMYIYTYKNVVYSSVQVYPCEDEFALVGKVAVDAGGSYNYDRFPLDPLESTDVALNKAWRIKFNKSLRTDTVTAGNIFICDVVGNVVPTSYDLMDDNRTVLLSPQNPYGAGRLYNIYITPRVLACDYSQLQNGIYATFYTTQAAE